LFGKKLGGGRNGFNKFRTGENTEGWRENTERTATLNLLMSEPLRERKKAHELAQLNEPHQLEGDLSEHNGSLLNTL